MSKMAIQRVLLVSALAVASVALIGCKDDDEKSKSDAGGDAGNGTGAVNGTGNGDAGPDTGGPIDTGVIKCGTASCEPNQLTASVALEACCVPDVDNVCGYDFDAVQSFGVPFMGCVEAEQPAMANGKEDCKKWIALAGGMVPVGDSSFDLTDLECCRPDGRCGIQLDTVDLGDIGELPVNLGCVALADILSTLPADAGLPPAAVINAAARCPAPDAGAPAGCGGDGGAADASCPADGGT